MNGSNSTGNLEAISAALTQATVKFSKRQLPDFTAAARTPTPVPTEQIGSLLPKHFEKIASTSLGTC